MTTWTLERARDRLSELVRRALAHVPQLVTRGNRDAVVVIAREDYEQLVGPENLADFLRNSPLAEAVRAGEIPENAFDRRREFARDIEL
jgi:prevent-host-death family protein